MSGGGGGRVLDCQSAPVNVRPARATAGSQTNYPGHHGAQDVSLRIALLLFRHSQTRHSELSGVRRRGAPRVAISTKEPALSGPRSRRPPDGSSPGLSLTCTDRPAPETSYQSRLPAGRPSRLSCSDSIQGPQAGRLFGQSDGPGRDLLPGPAGLVARGWRAEHLSGDTLRHDHPPCV